MTPFSKEYVDENSMAYPYYLFLAFSCEL